MTKRQAHRRLTILLRRASELAALAYDARLLVADTHGSHTNLAASAKRLRDSADLTHGLAADLFVQSSDILLKDVPK